MLGEAFNTACNVAQAALVSVNLTVAEPAVNPAELVDRAEIASSTLAQQESNIPNLQAPEMTCTQTNALLNPINPDMQVQYTNEALLDAGMAASQKYTFA